jgi:hypothetical protein
MEVEFKRKYSLVNGNKINKKNWHKVYAVSSVPCTNVKGVPEIDRQIQQNGAYYEKWELVFKPAKGEFPEGYIFREINHHGGINGRHKTYRQAIFAAISNRIKVYLGE